MELEFFHYLAHSFFFCWNQYFYYKLLVFELWVTVSVFSQFPKNMDESPKTFMDEQKHSSVLSPNTQIFVVVSTRKWMQSHLYCYWLDITSLDTWHTHALLHASETLNTKLIRKRAELFHRRELISIKSILKTNVPCVRWIWLVYDSGWSVTLKVILV